MPIKKRSSAAPSEATAPANAALNIQPGVKRPLPADSRITALTGVPAASAAVRRVGAIAAAVSDPTDELLYPADRVLAMRTTYDGKNPQEARYRNRVRNRGTAITAFCITCLGGRKAVTECIDSKCPLWAFRFGSDPFYGKRG